MGRKVVFSALAITILVLAGCTGTTPRRGDGSGTGATSSVTVGTTDSITSLDPGNAYEYLSINVLQNTMGQLLHYRSDSADLVPDLAAAMPTVSADGLTYTFRLKAGLTYADGSPLRARDFLWALERNSGRVGGEEGGPAFLIYDSPGVDVANSSAPNDTTLIVKLRQPGVFFNNLLVFPNFGPLPRQQYSKERWREPTGPTDNLPVSSGPYQVVEYRQSEFLRLERNPAYKGAHPAKSDEIIVKFFSTSASLKAAVERREVDVAYRTFSPGEWTDLKQRGGDLLTKEAPSPSPMRYLAFHVPTIKEPQVRKAFAHLVDREELNRVVFQNTYSPAHSIVPKGMVGQKDSFLEQYGARPDIARAKALLQTAGYSAANKLRIDLWFNSDGHYGDTEDELATLLKAQLERSGSMEVRLQSKPWVAYRQDLRQGLLPVFLIGWFPDYMDTDNYLSPFLTPGGARSFGTYYASPAADALIDAEQGDSNPTTRVATLEQLQDLAAEDAPYIPLVTGTAQVAYQQGVRGVILSPSQVFPYWTLEG